MYRRTARQVRQDPDEDYRLILPITGELLIRQDGRQVGFAPGRGSLITAGMPLEVVQPRANHAFVMTIPAAGVDVPFNLTAPLATSLDLATGLGRVVYDMLAELIAQRHSVGQRQFDAVSERIVELLCLLVVGDNRPCVPGHLAEVEAAIRRYARQHAADPDLSGAAIAHALGWSLRHIQHALHQAGTTPRDLIREERLQLVNQRLHDPAYQHLSITDLAHASGFTSASALNSQYRQHYGILPRTPTGENPVDDDRDGGRAPPPILGTSGT